MHNGELALLDPQLRSSMNKASNNHGSKSLSSYLTCKLVAPSSSSRHAAAHDEPQTATCCTALQRGFPSSGAGGPASSHPRFAPVRTPGSSTALAPQDQEEEHCNPIQEEEEDQENGQRQQQQRLKKIVTTTTAAAAPTTPTKTKKLSTPRAMVRKMVRKCKSSVADVDVSRIAAGHGHDDGDDDDDNTPRLRRSGAVRRDWSFEDLRTGALHKAV